MLDAVLSLAQAPSADEATAGILRTLARATPADAIAVLRADDEGALQVTAQIGLSHGVHRVRFRPEEHPRLARAARSAAPVRFDDPAEADPYDGLLRGTNAAVDPIHACLAAPLAVRGRFVGLLTMDALDPRGLDGVGDDDVRVFAALLAAAWRLDGALLLAPCRGAAGPALLGRSPAMQRVEREIATLAPLDTTVLVTGETGTGKELVARALHQRSRRAGRPIVTVNCAALPGDLLLSELFGHARGAFTGAAGARPGRFEAADGGTLFLDEIGDLPLAAQGPLLRALQSGEIQRVGEDRPRRVDVRVIAATHRDLPREAREGRFREDLLHRLWVVPIAVPALRERKGDIPILAEHFAIAVARRVGLRDVALDAGLLDALGSRRWPGNVRELEHAVERATVRRLASRGRPSNGAVVLRREDLDEVEGADPPPAAPGITRPLDDALEETRRRAFVEAFRATSGNAAKAARLLGLSRSFAYKEGVRLGLVPGPRR
ncbi:MAG TPA: sigma 54-interacting transcriptional regulator [Polyangiaceae bacterium]|nr:sigma 54-interacting transcriptional regulator [Polyangiaceae bacterium]